jgi:hypothetical protein
MYGSMRLMRNLLLLIFWLTVTVSGQSLVFSVRLYQLPDSFTTAPSYIGGLSSYAFYVNYTNPDTLKNDTTIVRILAHRDYWMMTDTAFTDTFSTVARSVLHYISVKSPSDHRNFYSLDLKVEGDTGVLDPPPDVNVIFDSLVEYNSRVSIQFNELLLLPLSSAPLVPRMGEVYFDEVDSTLKVYNGLVWKNCW